jgi:tetratricopeptide (TPR) repeat protein
VVLNGEGLLLASNEYYYLWSSAIFQDVNIRPLEAFDIDHDGNIEVITVVSAGYCLNPRGIFVFEYPSFEEEWFFPVAPFMSTISIIDLDNDGNLEIVTGSNAPCNGRKINNSDDCHAYVYALNLEGKLLWIREIGEGFRRVHIAVADLDGDGTREVVCGGWSFFDDWGELFILDSRGNLLRELGLDYSIYLQGVSDLYLDGSIEILVSDSKGFLAIYDSLLQLVEKRDIGVFDQSTLTINDLDGDGQKEIITISNDTEILVLNNELVEEWSISFPGYSCKVIVENLSGCKNDLLVLSDKLYLYSYLDQSAKPCMLPFVTRETVEREILVHRTAGGMFLKGGYYLRAIEEYDFAKARSQEIGDIKQVAEISELIAQASRLGTEKLFDAYRYEAKGDEKSSLADHEGAIDYYEHALEIFEELGRIENVIDVQRKIEIAQKEIETAKEAHLMKINKTILGISFVMAFAVTTYLYLGRRTYEDENKRMKFVLYLITVMSIMGALFISISSFSLDIGNEIYMLTIAILVFLIMILSAYSRRL